LDKLYSTQQEKIQQISVAHTRKILVSGLPVSQDGYPLSYSVFNGSQYESRTVIPTVEDFVQRFNLTDFAVVADSGLMNAKNISQLESGGYKYITGARIKNESEAVKQWILSLEKQDGSFYEMNKSKQCRLIAGYSDKRAGKDTNNRNKGV
jgi:transposase